MPGWTRTYPADVIVGSGVVESASPALVQQAKTGEVWTKLGLFGVSPIGADAVHFYADAGRSGD